jgi:SOS-response transcriptional repressor LexA
VGVDHGIAADLQDIRIARGRLQPANPNYPAQFYDDVRIQGKLIGVIRRLD